MCCYMCVCVCCLLTDVIKHQVTYLSVDTDQHSVLMCVCVLSVLTEISTVFFSVYMLLVCVVCVNRDQHSVPVCV